mmetsp:Transcript_28934/g.35797  ORF Transcript_28934/g.35797 Transcript_28934/m.35797 type:complete len:380 (+) Transcript_28934:1877-3016(+)
MAFFLFFLCALPYCLFLLSFSCFFGSASPISLLVFFVLALGFSLLAFGSEAFHSVPAIDIFLLSFLLGGLPRFDLGAQGESLFVGLTSRFHQLQLLLNLSILFISLSLMFLLAVALHASSLGSLCHTLLFMAPLGGLLGLHLSQGFLLLLQSLVDCVHFRSVGSTLIILLLGCKFLSNKTVHFFLTLQSLSALVVEASLGFASFTLLLQPLELRVPSSRLLFLFPFLLLLPVMVVGLAARGWLGGGLRGGACRTTATDGRGAGSWLASPALDRVLNLLESGHVLVVGGLGLGQVALILLLLLLPGNNLCLARLVRPTRCRCCTPARGRRPFIISRIVFGRFRRIIHVLPMQHRVAELLRHDTRRKIRFDAILDNAHFEN